MSINVLSCFDGMSCGQIALERAGIKVDNYFASEIDKYAVKVTQDNYPDTIQLGSIENWQSWDLPKIDLIIGGSPCQGFSLAGKGLNFDDPRSKLFFIFADILKAYKPKSFMLENVKMKKEWQNVISEYLGVAPILINSSLVSAQNRQRLYWANWEFDQPEDKDIYLKDIIEYGYVDRQTEICLDASYFKDANLNSYFTKNRRKLIFNEVKSNTLRARANNESLNEKGYKRFINKRIGTFVHSMKREDVISFRKLAPIECERLQTVPDNYTQGVSNTQRYKMLGNGWTVDVVSYILSTLEM